MYQQVNAHFCAAISAIIAPDDVIWIHDYHLLLLPQLVRNAHPRATIGFFLHIPFPTYEVYRMLPSAWRTALLDGLLGADLIGLHTPDDVTYLRTCLERLRHIPSDGAPIAYGDRTIAVVAAPVSIDTAHFAAAPHLPAVQQEITQLQEQLAERKLIMSVDRLDYSKGLLRRLQGYQHFLATHPEWHGRVVLTLVVVPSRIGVDHYQVLKQQLDEAVGQMNGQFGTIHWTPVIYQYRAIPFEALVALYRVGDVALITPLRDGMNLVCKEYVATRAEPHTQ
ncbi:MAG TPA: trehalose-6-phosphate synthase [Herpetosiphonaceae bacterium]